MKCDVCVEMTFEEALDIVEQCVKFNGSDVMQQAWAEVKKYAIHGEQAYGVDIG